MKKTSGAQKALKLALKKLPRLNDKATQENLDFIVGCCARCSEARALAEAYRIGAEEAQHEIVARLRSLVASEELAHAIVTHDGEK